MSDDAATHPRKRGRPPKAETDRKNTYLGFRVRDGMRERLEAAAEAGSRSPSEEIERRLALSFDIAPTPDDERLIRSLAYAVMASQPDPAATWRNNVKTAQRCFSAAQAAAAGILDNHSVEHANEAEQVAAAVEGHGIGTRSLNAAARVMQDAGRLYTAEEVMRLIRTVPGQERFGIAFEADLVSQPHELADIDDTSAEATPTPRKRSKSKPEI